MVEKLKRSKRGPLGHYPPGISPGVAGLHGSSQRKEDERGGGGGDGDSDGSAAERRTERD